MNEIPGEILAKQLGYTLYAHSGDYSSAIYSKGPLSLTITKEGKATVKAFYKLVTISSGEFSFPHPRFEIFENQVLRCLPID